MGAGLVLAILAGQTPVRVQPTARVPISYADAKPIFDALPDSLPPVFAGQSADRIEAAWPNWITDRNAEIRARLERGDEDSLVNLWLYGTSFTSRPPARVSKGAVRSGRTTVEAMARARLDDFLETFAQPGDNGRLLFARQFFERAGLDPASDRGRAQIRRRLLAARARAAAEFAAYDRTLANATERSDPNAEVAAHATIFRERGLSSDTSLLVDFAVEQTLRDLKARGVLEPATVRRVGIIGPGLDFINKADGYDFYPEQTIQPFALADSLLRLGLATPDRLRVTTFDLSPRVNHHLETALQRAAGGRSYTVHLPLDAEEQWTADLLRYWERFGDRVGEELSTEAQPATVDVAEVRAIAPPGVRLRTVRIRPDVVRSIEPLDVNIVVERLEPAQSADLFDVIVATNVFVYYDAFDQALAVANVARMLGPGGVLIANTLVFPTPPMRNTAAHAVVTYSERQYDHLFWYQRE